MLVRWTFAIKGVQIWCLEPGRIRSWIPLDRVWSDHPHFLKITLIWDNLQAFLKLVHLLGMIIFWISWFFRRRLRIFISKVILVTIRVFRGRVFTLLLFTLTFAGRSIRLQNFCFLIWLFKQKSHHLLEIIDRLLSSLKHLVLRLLNSSLLLKFSSYLLCPASQNTDYGYVTMANRCSRRVKSLPWVP